MTEAGEKWVAEVNRNRVPGGEVGIVHPIDAGAILRAFCAEFKQRTGHLSNPHQKLAAFDELKRELLGEHRMTKTRMVNGAATGIGLTEITNDQALRLLGRHRLRKDGFC